MTEIIEVETPQGLGRWHLAQAGRASAWLLLGHGAGGGIDAPDLLALANRLPGEGIAVARFDQPWRVAGKRVASPPPRLDEAWLAAHASLIETGRIESGAATFFGGRSAGARVACRTAFGRARGVVALAFPLHPPGKPAASRAVELAQAGVPTLVFQGDADPFGSAADVRAAVPDALVVEMAGCRHDLRPAKSRSTQADVQARIVADSLAFMRRLG